MGGRRLWVAHLSAVTTGPSVKYEVRMSGRKGGNQVNDPAKKRVMRPRRIFGYCIRSIPARVARGPARLFGTALRRHEDRGYSRQGNAQMRPPVRSASVFSTIPADRHEPKETHVVGRGAVDSAREGYRREAGHERVSSRRDVLHGIGGGRRRIGRREGPGIWTGPFPDRRRFFGAQFLFAYRLLAC